MHSTKTLAFGIYYVYCLWALNRDIVTIDLLYIKNKVRFTRIVKLSFPAKLYLVFGTPNFLKAMIYPCVGALPLNGLEFEHEEIYGYTNEMLANFDIYKLKD